MYHFLVTVTLTYDLDFRVIVYGAYLLYYLRYELQRIIDTSLGKCLWFSVKIKVCQSSLSSP